MPYCLKCGKKIDETMAFCPWCGTALKETTLSQITPVCEKEEKPEKRENPERGEHGFVGFLVSGLILVTIGVFAILALTSSLLALNQDVVIMLVIIGIIIISGAVYVTTPLRKYFRQLLSRPKKGG